VLRGDHRRAGRHRRGVRRLVRRPALGFGIGDDGYGMGGLGGSYGGTSTAGGYSVGFVTGTAGGFDRVDALEDALRGCLGLRAVS
jgi:hypothetical protein